MSTERLLFYTGNIAWAVILLTLVVATIYNVVMLIKEERQAK